MLISNSPNHGIKIINNFKRGGMSPIPEMLSEDKICLWDTIVLISIWLYSFKVISSFWLRCKILGETLQYWLSLSYVTKEQYILGERGRILSFNPSILIMLYALALKLHSVLKNADAVYLSFNLSILIMLCALA